MRIVAMLTIVAHHYVVNSGIIGEMDFDHPTLRMFWTLLAGFGGKMAINAFVLLSAYFMCEKRLTWMRVGKLAAEVWFYNIVIGTVFLICKGGLPWMEVKYILLGPLLWNTGFVASFIVFYLCIPFLNRMVRTLPRRQHALLTAYLLVIFSGVSTLLVHPAAWCYLGWYVTLYFLASYMRFYPCRWTESRRPWVWVMAVSLLLIAANIAVALRLHMHMGWYHSYNDSQKLLALTTGLSLFLLFKNTPVPQSRAINTISKSAFGVLLIHAHSASMRHWLWQDTLHCPEYYHTAWLPLHMLACVAGVYAVCTALDQLRIRLVERPVVSRLQGVRWLQRECFWE